MTPKKVAEWMLYVLKREGILAQQHAAEVIQRRFGPGLTCEDGDGRLSIREDVLGEFGRLSAGVAEWDARRRCWRAEEQGVDLGETIPHMAAHRSIDEPRMEC